MLWEDFLKYYDSIDAIYSGGDGTLIIFSNLTNVIYSCIRK